MEQDLYTLSHEWALSSSGLGMLYDKSAEMAMRYGRRFTIPESAQIEGYLRPALFRCELDHEKIRRIFFAENDGLQLVDEDAYVDFMTPHSYDEADPEGTYSSSVYIVYRAQVQGTDMRIEKTYDILCEDFLESNTVFVGEHSSMYRREGEIWLPADEISDAAGEVLSPLDELRAINVADFTVIMQLLDAAVRA